MDGRGAVTVQSGLGQAYVFHSIEAKRGAPDVAITAPEAARVKAAIVNVLHVARRRAEKSGRGWRLPRRAAPGEA